MALTKDDIQAIAALLQPINDRLTGVEGKLDGVEGRLTGVEGKLDGVEGRLTGVEGRLDGVEGRLTGVEGRLDKLDSEVMALRAGQIGIRTEIKEINQKISDTYELALDTWGKSTENREWIEKVNVN